MHSTSPDRRRGNAYLDGFLLSMAIAVCAIAGGPPARADDTPATRAFEVRETAGIRRFSYPVAAVATFDPPLAPSTRFRLIHDGRAIATQIRPQTDSNHRIPSAAIDFDASFLPFESRRYVLEFGPDISPGAEPDRGLKLDDQPHAFHVSHGANLQWIVPKDLATLLQSVTTAKWDYMRPGTAGLSIVDRTGVRHPIRADRADDWNARIDRQGPIACSIRFRGAVDCNGTRSHATVQLEFPRSKSWVQVTCTVEPGDGVAGLECEWNLNIAERQALVDFGAGSLVYAALGTGQIAVLEAAPAAAAAAAQRPLWATFRGAPAQLEPYVTARAGDHKAPEGWAHAMDRERCTAFAVADFARHSADRIEISDAGRCVVTRRFDPPGTHSPPPRSLRFWIHFVPFPPHVGAVTSPQSMQTPLEVDWAIDSAAPCAPADSARAAASTAEITPVAAARAERESIARDELASLRARAQAALAVTSGELKLDGLKDRVEVLRDAWGVPHIYAQNMDDLFFAQGFLQAQDRLWQMELWRRTAEGRLAEWAGPGAVATDRVARLVRFRGDMDAEWSSYSRDTQRIVHAFVRGVNACIDHSRDRLPIEFQLTGTRPEPWTPEVCLGRMAGLIMCRNATSEVLRAELARQLGTELAARLMPIDPPHPLHIPDGLDLDGIDQRVTAAISAGSAAVHVPLAPHHAAQSSGRRLPDLPATTQTPPDQSADIGSNNWTIAGRLTESGKPILANDPHRPIQLPSLRYIVHLHCPRAGDDPAWNVIGGTEPALPGVAIGHNERIAWGMTIVGTDQQDIYVEETHPDDPNRYRVGDEWQPMRIECEQVAVRGEAQPRRIELKFTRHGPVIYEDPERHRAYSLRWVGSEPGTAGYLGALALDRAQNWNDFMRAAERWKLPSENLVYADVDGHIGWIAAALTPVRSGWDGLLPVPGAGGKYEWAGFLPTDQLPQRYDPPEGYIATANHNILPRDYTHTISYEWSPPFRFDRIDEVFRKQLAAGRKFTLNDSAQLQHDAVSLPARRLLDRLRTIRSAAAPGPETDMLLDWNATLDRDSAAAALFELWLRKVVERVRKSHVPESVAERYAARLPLQAILELIDRPGAPFGDPPAAARDDMLIQSLRDASDEARKLLGPDPARWSWGRLHQAQFRHMLTAEPPGNPSQHAPQRVAPDQPRPDDAAAPGTRPWKALEAVLNLPSVPRGGDAFTPLAAGGPRFGRLEQTTGASYRQIIDLADWDRSLATSVPGQSGQPVSPHYGDLLALWSDGKYFPLLFSRGAVESSAGDRLVLVPAGP